MVWRGEGKKFCKAHLWTVLKIQWDVVYGPCSIVTGIDMARGKAPQVGVAISFFPTEA